MSTLRSLHLTQTEPYNCTLYFNPNCILQLILEYVCGVLHIDVTGDSYDFCTESGDLLGIKDYKATTSGLTIFRQRDSYFVVILTRGSFEKIKEMSPMLNPNSEICRKISKALKEKATQMHPKSSEAKVGKSKSSRKSLAITAKSSVTSAKNTKRKSSAAT